MGAQEIQLELGVSRQRVTQLTSRSDFPAPVAVLAMGKVWDRRHVERWIRATGRTPSTAGPRKDTR